jgi:hypothetical protein
MRDGRYRDSWYPTLRKERKGWGTRFFVVLTTVPNTNRGLSEELFLRKPHTLPWLGPRSRKSGVPEPVLWVQGWDTTTVCIEIRGFPPSVLLHLSQVERIDTRSVLFS